ncbi:MAG: hypothetical protein L0H93_13105 [Nocardioides sp.]|nr:hypothetical protein [Nocardioides sp.]
MNTEVNAFRRGAICGALLLAAATGCSEDPGAAVAGEPVSPSPSAASQEPSETPGGSKDPQAADIPLARNLDANASSPMWAFPVLVTGWSQATLDQGGVNQLKKDGIEATFTSYQLVQDVGGGADAANSKAYLVDFASQLSRNSQIEEVSTPKLSTTTIDSDRGALEFVQQDLTYTTTDGTTYRSRYLARSVDTYVLAVQYAGPEPDWSEREWTTLLDAGLSAVLGV